MPKVPTDYTKIVIYKLVHKEDFDNANIYIGSTTNFTKRKGQHKSSCNNEKGDKYNQKKYQSIRNNGGWSEWNMIEIEKYPCNDKREAEAKEEYWKTHFNAVLNSRACISLIDDKKEYWKKYSEDNKKKIAEYRQDNKGKKKMKYETNKEKINQQRRENYAKKREQNNQTV